MRLNFIGIFICILIFYSFLVLGQRTFHIDVNDGLSTNNLTDLYFDSKENLWIGSYNGLMKYEGGRITKYGIQGLKKYCLTSLEMHSVIEDKCGLIWIATTNGVNILNPESNEIDKIFIKPDSDSSSFIGYIYWICQDKEEFIWISTDIGMFKIDNNSHYVEKIKYRDDQYGLPTQLVSYTGGISDDNGMWILTSGGLCFYEYKSKLFYHKYYNPNMIKAIELGVNLRGNQGDIRMDHKGNLWFIHNNKYLLKFNPTTNAIDSFYFELSKDVWQCCKSLAIDGKGSIWIGTRHGGILVFDPAKCVFTPYQYKGMNSLIQSNYIHSIESNGKNLIFISTNNGLDIIDYYNHSIKEISLSDDAGFKNLKYQAGDASYEPFNQKLYLPFYSLGFFTYDIKSDSICLDEVENGTALVIPNYPTIQLSYKGKIVEYNAKKHKIVLNNKPLLDIINQDKAPIIWHQSISKNEFLIKKNSGMIYHVFQDTFYKLRSVGFKPNLCISEDSLTMWYINSDLNLTNYNIQNHQTKEYNIQTSLRKTNVNFSNPRHMLDDGSALWITSQNGILRYNYLTDSLTNFTVEDGLLHNFTFSIIRDLDKNIWIGSLGGINKYDCISNSFINILPLRSTTYMDAFGSIICTEDGILYFHFGNKIYRVDPKYFLQPADAKKLNFSEININGYFYQPKDAALMALPHSYSNVKVSFSLNDFVYPSLALYKYQINDGGWIEIGNSTNIQFYSLKPGAYKLEIAAKDYFNEKAENQLILNFNIKPLLYQTWWFYRLIFLISLMAFYFWYKLKLKAVNNKNKIALQIAELKATAIKAQLNPHFIFNSLNSIQECVINEETEKAYDYIILFSKILRMVLNYSEQNNISIFDEMELIKIYVRLESIRFKNDINLDIHFGKGVDAEMDFIPSLILQPLIENAIWHGLRDKPGEKNIWIDFETQENYLLVSVIDNGLGYKDDNKSKKYESKGIKLVTERVDAQFVAHPVKVNTFEIETLNLDAVFKGTKIKIVLPKHSNINKLK